MAKKLKIKYKVTVVIYHPVQGVEETLKPQYTFEGDVLPTKMTEYIFHHMRKALRMEKAKLAKKEKEDDNGKPES